MTVLLRNAFAPVLVLVLLALVGVVMMSQLLDWVGSTLRDVLPVRRD